MIKRNLQNQNIGHNLNIVIMETTDEKRFTRYEIRRNLLLGLVMGFFLGYVLMQKRIIK